MHLCVLHFLEMQEEYTTLKRKYERLRKIEQSHNADEVLLAEIQDYKVRLIGRVGIFFAFCSI